MLFIYDCLSTGSFDFGNCGFAEGICLNGNGNADLTVSEDLEKVVLSGEAGGLEVIDGDFLGLGGLGNRLDGGNVDRSIFYAGRWIGI